MIAQIKNSGLFTATTPAPTAPADGYKQAPVPATPVPVEQLPVKP